MSRLQDKVVLVSGGTDGIGLACARWIAGEGARAVVVTGRDPNRGAAAQAELGGRASYLQQDVRQESRWDDVVREVTDHFGRLDVVVNNAGFAGSGAVQDPEELSLSEWRSVMAVNLDGVFLGCRAAIRAMKNTGGSIVNISSTAGLLATPSFAAYGAAKSAVTHLTKSVAVYCARRGYPIRCNSVHPALVDTSLRDQILGLFGGDDGTARATYLARVPLGTFGTAEDVAAAVVYLAGDESRYVTGSQLVVGGGLGV